MYNSLNPEIREEISNPLLSGKTGCIVFDFGAFFPYADDFSFTIGLGLETLPDQKLNHRYPNKNYYTITRKYGRKLSKVGYPYYFDLSESKFSEPENKQMFLLYVKTTIGKKTEIEKSKTVTAVFPLKPDLTKKKPVCSLSLRFNVEKMEYKFVSYEKKENDIGYIPIVWSNIPKDNMIPLILSGEINDEEKTMLMFNTVIEPPANKYDDFYI